MSLYGERLIPMRIETFTPVYRRRKQTNVWKSANLLKEFQCCGPIQGINLSIYPTHANRISFMYLLIFLTELWVFFRRKRGGKELNLGSRTSGVFPYTILTSSHIACISSRTKFTNSLLFTEFRITAASKVV